MRRGERLSLVLGLLLAACSPQLSGDPICSGDKCDDPTVDPTDPVAEGETRVTFESKTVFRDYEIDEPSASNDFTVRYRGVGRHELTLDLVKVENAHGLAMWFIVDDQAQGGSGTAPYGARLYRATLHGRELLYTNGDGKVSPNWGPRAHGGGNIIGWIGLGGAEAAFPVDEHGYYSATRWDYEFAKNPDGSLTFTSSTVGDPGGDGSMRLAVAVSYTVPTDGAYWRTKVEIHNPDGHDKGFQYWHNYMLPAGRFDDRNDVEVLLPELSQIEVHSTGDQSLKLPGSLEDGGHSIHAFSAGGKISKVHGPQGQSFADRFVQGWLGFFSTSQRVARYGFYNHSSGLGLGMTSTSGEATIFPKAFGGAGIGPENWTAEGSRYVEMWYSVNTPSFWQNPPLAGQGSIEHETLVFPMLESGDLQKFDPAHPERHRPEAPVVPDSILETFDGPGKTADDGTTTGTLDADWNVWYDGNPWGGGHRMTLDGGAQKIGLDNGSYGIQRNLGAIGGKTLTITHTFGGDGWYEILAGDTLLKKHESSFSGTESFTLPAGTSEIRIKVGSQGTGFHEAVIDQITIE